MLLIYEIFECLMVMIHEYKAMHARQHTHSNVRLFCLRGVCASFLSLLPYCLKSMEI